MESLPSLTQVEAQERAALIAVDSYDIDIDITDMLDGSQFRAVSTIRFTCTAPGASTFLDAALDVLSATLNGQAIGAEHIAGARIQLHDLQADNVLVVHTVQPATSEGEYVRRSVDHSDDEVYVWMSFEPDDARRAWACFDQPDLKAPHRFTVTAVKRWLVVSNSGDPMVEEVDGARRWTFPETPPLSTYVPVVVAGPFHEVRRELDGFDLGLLTRRSLAPFLDRDADELFAVTAQGLTFFGDRFGLAFPQRKYDQVFLPDMGGAMENYGCVCWSDAFIYRSEPTYAEREQRALVLLHEMAHMWFGDMVTMTWWDDLWLNEAFAEWACYWAAVSATEFTDAWSSFLAGDKLGGYAADMAPTTHPIRQPVVDVDAAAASFDGITYPKGASVLKQLFAYVGEEPFVAGLRAYFSKHAWGNTRLDDLMSELGEASGRDLSEWTRGWLDTAGTDRLALATDEQGQTVLEASGPAGAPPRSHRINVGVYDREDDVMVRRRIVELETSGASTPVVDVDGAELLLVNDDDLAFASVRPLTSSIPTLLSSAPRLPTAVDRAVAVTTAWDMLVNGELRTTDFVGCVTSVLPAEDVTSMVEPYLDLAARAADSWSPDESRDELLSTVADTCLELLADPARRQVAIRTLARTAVTDAHFQELRASSGDDVDLRWRALTRMAELQEVSNEEIDGLEARDPDPDAWVRAMAVRTARPDSQQKDRAWKAIVDEHKIPMGSLNELHRAFWRRSQAGLLAPYADRYLEVLPKLHLRGMIPALAISGAMYPRAGVDEGFAERAVAAAGRDGVSPVVARTVIEHTDELRRKLRARSA